MVKYERNNTCKEKQFLLKYFIRSADVWLLIFFFFAIAQVRQITSEAPAISKVFAHSSKVAPVVFISSQRRILLSRISISGLGENTPKRLPFLKFSSRKCWSPVS